MKKILISLFFSFTLLLSLSAQNTEQAKVYFSQYMDSKSLVELCLKSFPTLEECRLVFKAENADTYFASLEEWKTKMTNELKNPVIKFTDLKIESFTTEDVLQDKGNYSGGMKKIADKLQPNITFYNLNMMQTKGEGYGINYQSMIYLNGKWLFFPKPWHSFK